MPLTAPEISNPNSISLLLIEDEDLQAELLKRQLDASARKFESYSPISFNVHHVHNLSVGLALLREKKFDATILDLTLPDSAGLTTLEAFRDEQPTMPVIVVTGDDNIVTSQIAIHQKAQEFIVKGEYSGMSLVRSIFHAIERERMNSALQFTREQLVRSEQLHRQLIQELPIGIVILDNDRYVQYINHSAADLLHPILRDNSPLVFDIPLTVGLHTDIAIPSSTNDFTFAELHVHETMFEGSLSLLLTITDISERRKFEHRKEYTRRLSTLGMLSGSIAHDINNLLSPILLGVQAMQRSVTDERHEKILSMIEQSTRRGADLVRQVLNFSRSAEPRSNHATTDTLIRLSKERFVQSLQINETLSKLSNEVNIQVELDSTFVIQNNLPDGMIACDVSQITDALVSVFHNAVEACTIQELIQSPVRINIDLITVNDEFKSEVKSARDGTYIRFTIIDSGCGIEEQSINKIFEPFYSTKTSTGHSGIGLYSLNSIIKRHKGFVHVESEVGGGTTFSIFLPAVQSSLQSVEVRSIEMNKNVGVLTLVGEATMRDMIHHTLEYYGFLSRPANDAGSVLELYKQNIANVRIIILDITIPELDARQLITAVHRMNTDVRIILITGIVEQRLADELSQISISRVISKPYTTEDLLQSLYQSLA
jgi:two-component system, cell cycle sensor histidine kinase and response regulator CckA